MTSDQAGGELAAALARITLEQLDDDPYPVYAWLREHAPVAWIPAVGLWLVTTWAAVEAAATDAETFSAGVTPSPLERTMGEGNILLIDGPRQKRLRQALDPSLRPRQVERNAVPLIAPLVDGYLERIEGRGQADLMAEYFEPISVRSLALVLGIAEIDDDTLRRWFAEMAIGATNFEGDAEKDRIGMGASAEVDERLQPIMRRMLAEPDGSTISNMLQEADGSFEERLAWIMPTIKIIITGGMQEPGHAGGSTVFGLLANPEQSAALAADPAALVRPAVEEGLRWISPIGTQTRRATRATTLAGVAVPAGANLGLLVSAANRDPLAWGEDAEQYDLYRAKRPHGGFGFGTHFCPGHHLSRVQMRLAIEALYERCRNLRFDPDQRSQLRGWEFRAPTHLHVRWDR